MVRASYPLDRTYLILINHEFDGSSNGFLESENFVSAAVGIVFSSQHMIEIVDDFIVEDHSLGVCVSLSDFDDSFQEIRDEIDESRVDIRVEEREETADFLDEIY